MTWVHRSLDGLQMHDGLVDVCPECSHITAGPLLHDPNDHHTYVDVSMSGVGAGGVCYCGDPEDSAIHEPPYCERCRVPEPDSGAHRTKWRAVRHAVRRFVLGVERGLDWLGSQFSGVPRKPYDEHEVDEAMRRHPAGKKKGQEK